MEFKQGQKVRAIRTVKRIFEPCEQIVEGTIYTVDRTTDLGTNVYLKGYTQHFNHDRFELAEDVIDFTKPVETQDGRSVTIVLTDARGDDPIRGYIEDETALLGWRANGQYYRDEPNWRDLRNVPPKPLEREVYVNVYKANNNTLYGGSAYNTLAEADGNSGKSRVGRIKVKLVEGQYDA